VLSVPIFSLLLTGNTFVLFVFLMIQQIYIAMFSANFFPTLIRIFSPEVRYTGIALCYNLTWAGMATLPVHYTKLLDSYGMPWVVPIILSIIAGLSLLATRGIEKSHMESLGDQKKDGSIKYNLAG
jgi:hypothetical protein